MITKDDCMSILVKLEDNGVDKAIINKHIKSLMLSKFSSDIPLEVLKFISANRGIEVANFYEILRKSHNEKKSPLYTNIVRDISNRDDILTTLSSFLTQIFLHCRKIDNSDLFLKEVRASEITQVLNEYCITGNIENCEKMLRLLKADLLVLEYIAGRRNLA